MNQHGLAKSAILAASIAVLAGCSSTMKDDMATDTAATDTATTTTTAAADSSTSTAGVSENGLTAEQIQARQDAAFAADTLFSLTTTRPASKLKRALHCRHTRLTCQPTLTPWFV